MPANGKSHKQLSPTLSSTSSNKTESLNTSVDDDWQLQILERLQRSATPEPIKVACTVTPAGKPDYLGEEYHGKLTREEEKSILDGKNGRYMVRDSFTKSVKHEFTLAFNYDNTIQHVKLIYNENTKLFSTDADRGSGFKTVLELMTDVLRLYSDLKRRESQGFVKKGQYNKSHVFKVHTYKHPKWCDVCGNFLWGFINQGEKCEDCGINSHKICKDNAPLPCSTVVLGRKLSSVKEDEKVLTKERSKTDTGSSNYVYLLPKNPIFDHCRYFRKCSRFLSAFNIRDTYIDMQSNMTRCFCDGCTQKTSSNACSSKLFENLKQWTRFQFELQNDPLKRDVTKWEVVYFATSPKYVKDLIKSFYSPPENEDEEEIVVAPSLAYTTQDMVNENWSYKFSDTESGDELYAQTVMEVYLRPNSFEVMPGSDQPGQNDGIVIIPEHWKAKSRKDILPKSILVKIFSK